MPTTYFFAWWNVENLFDYETSPRRTEKLRRAIGSDLNGWIPGLRDRLDTAGVVARDLVIVRMVAESSPDRVLADAGLVEIIRRVIGLRALPPAHWFSWLQAVC